CHVVLGPGAGALVREGPGPNIAEFLLGVGRALAPGMLRSAVALALSLVSALAVMAERDASACGGCFHPPTQSQSDITDERMLLSVSTLQTTLYDQIRYSGTPSSFAWVLPI